MKTNLTDKGSLILRVAFSISLIMVHGWDKLSMVLAGDFDFLDPIGIGPTFTLILLAVAEFICPILIIVGIKVRYAAIPIIIAMLVALLIFHSGDSFEERELAYVYAVAFITIWFLDAGKYSLDYFIAERNAKTSNR